MPRYDFTCPKCGVTFEAIQPSGYTGMPCADCFVNFNLMIIAEKQLSYPASIQVH